MKTHTIKTPTAELLIVELPEAGRIEKDDWYIDDASNVRQSVIEYNEDYWSRLPDYIKIHEELFPLFTEHTLLGKPDEISEEDARELVHKVEGYNPVLKEFHPAYRLYKGRIIRATHTAKESLLSLLESEIYWDVNPIKVHTWASENADIYHKQWQEAQEKTFDRSRTLIFVKD